MDRPRKTVRLIAEDGSSRLLGPQGLMIGRGLGCDVIVNDDRASSRHALVRLAGPGKGVEIQALGRHPTLLDGVVVDGSRAVAATARLEVPGGSWTLEVIESPDLDGAALWFVHTGSDLHRVPAWPLTIGGSVHDELRLVGWPAGALTLYTAGTALLAEACDVGLHVRGEPIGTDQLPTLRDGDVIGWKDGATLSVIARPATVDGLTAGETAAQGPPRVHLRYQPVGGELEIALGGPPVLCSLSEMRSNLIALLLDPPAGFGPGDWIPDEVVIARIWPRQPERSHFDLNTLVHRIRKDLARAGIDPTPLLLRARRGGGTRFLVPPGTEVVVS